MFFVRNQDKTPKINMKITIFEPVVDSDDRSARDEALKRVMFAEKYGDRRRIRFETDRAQFFIIKTVETELLLTDQKLPSATVVVRTAA